MSGYEAEAVNSNVPPAAKERHEAIAGGRRKLITKRGDIGDMPTYA